MNTPTRWVMTPRLACTIVLLSASPVQAAGQGDAAPAPVIPGTAVPGITFADQDARLSFPVAGTVQAVGVRPGDTVKKGQELAVLDDSVGLAQIEFYRVRAAGTLGVEAAEKEWKLSQVEERLVREALAKGSAGQFEVDRAELKAQVDELQMAVEKQKKHEAELQLAQAQAAHEQHVLRSPIDGVVEEVGVAPGEGVEANKPVLRVVSGAVLRVEVHAPTALTQGLHRGDRLLVQMRWGDEQKEAVGGDPGQEASVTQVAAVADARSDTRLVRLTLENTRNMPAGMQAMVWFDHAPAH